MRAIDPALFPNVVGRAARGGAGPDARAGAGGAGGALHDGRDRDRPAGALLGGGALRGGRVLVHGPARRQSPGVELVERVLRVRAPGGGGGARGAALPARRARASSRRWAELAGPPQARRRRARRCGAMRASSARRRVCERLARRSPSAGAPDRALRAASASESRGAHRRTDRTRRRIRRWTIDTWWSRRTSDCTWETWE